MWTSCLWDKNKYLTQSVIYVWDTTHLSSMSLNLYKMAMTLPVKSFIYADDFT